MSAREIHLWVRRGRQAKAIAAGSVPPGPGRVMAVQAGNAHEARRKLARWSKLAVRFAALETDEAREVMRKVHPILAHVREVEVVRPEPAVEPDPTHCHACGQELPGPEVSEEDAGA